MGLIGGINPIVITVMHAMHLKKSALERGMLEAMRAPVMRRGMRAPVMRHAACPHLRFAHSGDSLSGIQACAEYDEAHAYRRQQDHHAS